MDIPKTVRVDRTAAPTTPVGTRRPLQSQRSMRRHANETAEKQLDIRGQQEAIVARLNLMVSSYEDSEVEHLMLEDSKDVQANIDEILERFNTIHEMGELNLTDLQNSLASNQSFAKSILQAASENKEHSESVVSREAETYGTSARRYLQEIYDKLEACLTQQKQLNSSDLSGIQTNLSNCMEHVETLKTQLEKKQSAIDLQESRIHSMEAMREEHEKREGSTTDLLMKLAVAKAGKAAAEAKLLAKPMKTTATTAAACQTDKPAIDESKLARETQRRMLNLKVQKLQASLDKTQTEHRQFAERARNAEEELARTKEMQCKLEMEAETARRQQKEREEQQRRAHSSMSIRTPSATPMSDSDDDDESVASSRPDSAAQPANVGQLLSLPAFAKAPKFLKKWMSNAGVTVENVVEDMVSSLEDLTKEKVALQTQLAASQAELRSTLKKLARLDEAMNNIEKAEKHAAAQKKIADGLQRTVDDQEQSLVAAQKALAKAEKGAKEKVEQEKRSSDEIANLRQELDAASGNATKLRNDLEVSNGALADARSAVDTLETENAAIREEIERATEQGSSAGGRASELEGRLEEMQGQLRQQTGALQEKNKLLEEAKVSYEELKSETEKRLERSQEQLVAAEEARARAATELEESLRGAGSNQSAVGSQKRALEEREARLKEREEALKAGEAALLSERAELETRVASVSEETAKLGSDRETMQKRNTELLTSVAEAEARAVALTEQQEGVERRQAETEERERACSEREASIAEREEQLKQRAEEMEKQLLRDMVSGADGGSATDAQAALAESLIAKTAALAESERALAEREAQLTSQKEAATRAEEVLATKIAETEEQLRSAAEREASLTLREDGLGEAAAAQEKLSADLKHREEQLLGEQQAVERQMKAIEDAKLSEEEQRAASSESDRPDSIASDRQRTPGLEWYSAASDRQVGFSAAMAHEFLRSGGGGGASVLNETQLHPLQAIYQLHASALSPVWQRRLQAVVAQASGLSKYVSRSNLLGAVDAKQKEMEHELEAFKKVVDGGRAAFGRAQRYIDISQEHIFDRVQSEHLRVVTAMAELHEHSRFLSASCAELDVLNNTFVKVNADTPADALEEAGVTQIGERVENARHSFNALKNISVGLMSQLQKAKETFMQLIGDCRRSEGQEIRDDLLVQPDNGEAEAASAALAAARVRAARLAERLEEARSEIESQERRFQGLAERRAEEMASTEDSSFGCLVFFASMQDSRFRELLGAVTRELSSLNSACKGEDDRHVPFNELRERIDGLCLNSVPMLKALQRRYGLLHKKWTKRRKARFLNAALSGGDADEVMVCPICDADVRDNDDRQLPGEAQNAPRQPAAKVPVKHRLQSRKPVRRSKKRAAADSPHHRAAAVDELPQLLTSMPPQPPPPPIHANAAAAAAAAAEWLSSEEPQQQQPVRGSSGVSRLVTWEQRHENAKGKARREADRMRHRTHRKADKLRARRGAPSPASEHEQVDLSVWSSPAMGSFY